MLTHWGLATPYGDKNIGQHWRHQAITCTNADLRTLANFPDQYRWKSIRFIYQIFYLKINFLKYFGHLPGANELIHCCYLEHAAQRHLSCWWQDGRTLMSSHCYSVIVWWPVSICPGNGLTLSSSRLLPEPRWTQFYVAICHWYITNANIWL